MKNLKRKLHKSHAQQKIEQLLRLKKRLEMLESIVAVMPGNVYWLDRGGMYLGCNDNEANSVGLKSRSEIIGKKNIDIPGFVIPEFLDPVNEKIMSEGQELAIEEPVNFPDGAVGIFLSKKVPLRNRDGVVVGMVGISFDITDRKKQEQDLKEAKEKAEAALQAKEAAEKASRQKSKDLKRVLEDFSRLPKARYYLSGKYAHIYLTKREAQCLLCLPLGLSSKKIAKQLGISFRTVEQHVDNIKNKLGCRTRAELIQAAIECSFLESVSPAAL